MELILAEQLLLLALDDEKGSLSTYVDVDAGLAGALLIDLTRRGALIEADGDLVASPDGAHGHPLLTDAAAAIRGSDKRRDAKGWVGRLPRELKPIKDRVAGALVERGILSEERRKILGLVPSTRFPEADPAPERELRARLEAVLLSQRDPSEDEALLLALLEPYDLARKLVPKDRRKEAGKRAKAIAERGPATAAVASSVRDTQTAVMAGVMAGVAASSVSGGGGDGGGGGGG